MAQGAGLNHCTVVRSVLALLCLLSNSAKINQPQVAIRHEQARKRRRVKLLRQGAFRYPRLLRGEPWLDRDGSAEVRSFFSAEYIKADGHCFLSDT